MTARARGQWILLSLLVISVTINYIDRGNPLQFAASRLSSELSLEPRKNRPPAVFFFLDLRRYADRRGWLIDRYSVYWIFRGGIFHLVGRDRAYRSGRGIRDILALRLVLGMGESVAYPAYSKIIAQGLRSGIADSPTGLIDAGCKAGPALGLMIAA